MANYPEFGWQVCEVSETGRVMDYIALASNFTAAKAAYLAILPERPGRRIMLTAKARIILDSREMEEGDSGPKGGKLPG